ncbi:exodeoxyribonuclease VII large subunit [Caulobacter ginsengisoli]|uniref:Exodeoxyribonuclease 7 large subunit n=1 Tax=Caulobacter ginsengisoli TaxID=400775 RepID=A0ABU0IR88_9CAUL|nr:exodeoxyribonuclease VII large subunit [Caulobacter ginsengisoli]MDQ0464525.1 exodeoxyribonuclease VII large subunit [Caulobacter ginsengisoli]
MSEADSETTNAQAYSVSELAFALKRTLEDAYGFVRLRGELSKVTHHSNGHVYLTLKDDKAALDGVVWKGSVRGLGVRPEHGLEVIVTGRITTYPAGSRYQIVIETMEAAGIGALLAQLERLKARLAAEGLFAPERKRAIPSMPSTVAVITSPTGAVIRDILHRIRDRWPCRVIVWPVVVQGDQAAAQVAGAIRGFNALGEDGPLPRPDLIIVARGGGSVEDLWPFNDEALARAVVEGTIPLISAVGHETDTTLIDFVSDRRAPTPTAAAEMATPVLADLKAVLSDFERRMSQCGGRMVEDRRQRLTGVARGLPRPDDILALARQRFDNAASRLSNGLRANVDVHERALLRSAGRLQPGVLKRSLEACVGQLGNASSRLNSALISNVDIHERALLRTTGKLQPGVLKRSLNAHTERLSQVNLRFNRATAVDFDRTERRLKSVGQLLETLNPSRPLQMGFALVRRSDGSLVHQGASLSAGEEVSLKFADTTRQAVIDGASGQPAPPPPAPRAKPKAPPPGQGDLF